ncbi:hypothetical protein ACIQWV_38300 [Streptomyces sp. NPDC098085]|uniref:hypothetical protein n=1 Tax=Streptomyces sp. NPDC098085 TaxID=3366094 RepID=UPI0037F6AD30
MSDGLTDLLASIDDVLQGAPAPAPAPAPVAVPAPVGPAAPVEPEPEPVEQRSTLTDVEYVRVGPAIAARLHPPRPPLPARPPAAAVVKDVSPVPAEPAETETETETETAVKAEVEEAEAEHWWQKKPTAETAEAETAGAELSAETIAAAVAAGVAAGTATGGAAAATAPREPNSRLWWLLHNGGAAAAGHLVLWSLSGDPMAGAHYMARMAVSVPEVTAAGLTVVAAYGGWRAGGFLSGLPGRLGLAARPLGAVMAALWGAGSAPLVQSALDSAGPLGTLLSPLLAAGPLAAACWYGLDRRAAAAHLIPPVRWVLRIPLATVVVSSLIYNPGAVL